MEDELPDNFDQAYNWFTQQYSAQKAQEDQGTDPLLNASEQTAISSFLDNVLVDPTHATEGFESRWMEGDFYRGFQDVLHGPPAARQERKQELNPGPQPYVAHEPFKMHTMTIPDRASVPGYHVGAPYAPLGVASGQASVPLVPHALHDARLSAPSAPAAHTAHTAHIPTVSAVAPAIHNVPGAPSPGHPRALSPPSPGRPLSPAKRPKPAVRKPKREILSESEVRQKHITSEKRRRDLISLHFKNMCAMVPAIEQAPPNLPKSTVLQYTYDFMLHIARENKQLRQRLAVAGVDTSGVPAHKLQPELED